MSTCLRRSITLDLEAWEPAVRADRLIELADRIAHRLESNQGRADIHLTNGGHLSWLYDPRSGQLLVTFPNGAHRIRSMRSFQSAS